MSVKRNRTGDLFAVAPDEPVDERMLADYASGGSPQVTAVRGDEFRAVAARGHSGRISFTAGTVGEAPAGWWRPPLADYVKLLTQSAGLLAYGHAFGVQLLGPGYAGRLDPSDAWEAQVVGGDATLVAHVDAGAWFDAPFETRWRHWSPGRPHPPVPPVPQILAAARDESRRFSKRRARSVDWGSPNSSDRRRASRPDRSRQSCGVGQRPARNPFGGDVDTIAAEQDGRDVLVGWEA